MLHSSMKQESHGFSHVRFNIEERKLDILSLPEGTYIAHCISGDFTLGAGLAKKLDEKYNPTKQYNDSC